MGVYKNVFSFNNNSLDTFRRCGCTCTCENQTCSCGTTGQPLTNTRHVNKNTEENNSQGSKTTQKNH